MARAPAPPLWLALSLALAALVGLPAPSRAEESSAGLLHEAGRYAGLLRDALPILGRSPDTATLRAVLHDARRTVTEIDRLSANATIYGASARDRQSLLDLAAAAHLRLALFETHGLEFDRARQEIARARALSDGVASPDFRTEWVALQDGAPGKGIVTRYHLLGLSEFEAALASIWSRARAVPFEFRGYGAESLLSADLIRTPPPDADSLEDRLLTQGAAQMREALDQGKRSFAVSLPPGLYRLRGRGGSDLDRAFIVPEVSETDPVVVDRARFTLSADPRPGPRGPRFFLNGLEVTDLTTMPYGVYRVKADREYFPAAPEVVRFVLGEGLSDKTRTDWTIYVPGGTEAVFRLDRAPLGNRMLHR